MIRDVLLLGLGFVLTTLQGAVGAVAGAPALGVLMPNTLLPIVLYLGMSLEVSLARGATLSFMLGFFLDAATGNSMGLFTFVHVASFLVARGAGFRLLIRGRLSQVLATAATAAIGSGVLIALRSIFRATGQFEAVSMRHLAAAVIAPALCTGAISPFIYQLVRRIDTLRRRDEATAAL